MPFTRRTFVGSSTSAFLGSTLFAQSRTGITRLDVASSDHDRILAAAEQALKKSPNPLPPIAGSPGTRNDFYSTESVTAHADALLELSLLLPALAAAVALSREHDPTLAAQLRTHAAAHLDAWFVDPSTRMAPALPYARLHPLSKDPDPEAILETTGLAEVAVAIPFLGIDASPYKPWFADLLHWLTEDRTALLARDSKDHLGGSWLLQSAAFAHLTGDETILSDLRHRFKTITIRAQIDSPGIFRHELTTPNPYRNSLFALDLLAGVAVLLSTRFDSLWNHELQDGPGLRTAVARHVPYIEKRGTWPYPSDLTHFKDLPCRRPSILFAARAYSSPEYAELWRSLSPAQPAAPELLQTFPIRQPLLWTTQPSII